MTVPRGTLPPLREVRRVPLTDAERKSLKLGVRTVIRREIKASNVRLINARFADLDLHNAYVHPYAPAMELRARADVARGRRSVAVMSLIRVGDVIVSGNPKGPQTRFSTCYVVRKIECHRIKSVTMEQALLNGFVGEHYEATLQKLGRKNRARWEQSEHHRVALIAPDAADVFALDWIATHGLISWRLNPWVWAYTLEIWEADPTTVIRQLDIVARR